MTLLFDAVWSGVSVTLALLLPLALVAGLGAIVGGLIANLLGVRDAAMALVVRFVAVLVAVAISAPSAATRWQSFTAQTWSSLAELGRAR